MEHIITQLKERQVFKVAAIYVLSAWPLIQIADILAPALGLPNTVMQLMLSIFIVGFPISLIFAWLINFTPEGMVLVGSAEDEQTATRSAYKINLRAFATVAGSLGLAVLVTLGAQLWFDEPMETSSVETSQPLGLVATDNRKSIAVLPFVVFSDDPADEFFVDGMVEELLNLLANIPDLQVAARTSSFSFKGVTDKTIVEIGQELGVDTILEGSLRKNDVSNQIRVTAQLIEVSTGAHLFSEVYEEEYLDIFQIQDNIAQAVVEKMKVTLLGESPVMEFAVGTTSVEAMVEYGKGQTELTHRTAPALEKALQHFKAAVAIDENYARAHVGLSDAYILLALYGSVPMEDANAAAQQAIDTALTLNPNLAAAHASQGLLFSESHRFEQAEVALKRAIELNPSYAMAYMWYGTLQKSLGDLPASQRLFEKALELDPKSPVAAYNVAFGHYQLGDEEKAMEFFSTIIANDPYYPGAYLLVGDILRDLGQLDEAISMYQRALRVDPVSKSAISGLLVANMDLENFAVTDQWFSYLEKNTAIFTTNELAFMKIRSLGAKGEFEKALAIVAPLEYRPEEAPMQAYSNGEIAFYGQEYAAAAKAFQALKDSLKDNGQVFFHMSSGQAALHLAYSYLQLDQQKQANELIDQYEQHLDTDVAKKAKRPEYYYNMALVKALRDDEDAAFDYLQGAIDAGFVQAWRANLEPILAKMASNNRFGLMMGGVDVRLAIMRTRMDDQEMPALAEE